MKVGLIGFGRLGKLAAKNLSQDTTLKVFEKEGREQEILSVGATPVSLKECCECPVVLLMVPISHLKDLVQEISPFIKKNTLVIDVCSVKVKPLEWMVTLLVEHLSILKQQILKSIQKAIVD